MKKQTSGRVCGASAGSCSIVVLRLLISAAVVHIVPAAVLRFVLAGIAAGVLSLVLAGIAAGILGAVLTGIAAGILSAVLFRIHGIGSMAVSAVVHITVMISHNVSLLFGL